MSEEQLVRAYKMIPVEMLSNDVVAALEFGYFVDPDTTEGGSLVMTWYDLVNTDDASEPTPLSMLQVTPDAFITLARLPEFIPAMLEHADNEDSGMTQAGFIEILRGLGFKAVEECFQIGDWDAEETG